MKKIFSICLIILLIFSCSKKDDSLKVDCSSYLNYPPSLPAPCFETPCTNDTCLTYLSIWKHLLISRNNMTQDYFDNHITVCRTNLNKWNDGISFEVSYKIKIEWAEVILWDQFIIWLDPSTAGLYPSIDIPRSTLLAETQITSALNLMAFSSGISTISSINDLKFHSRQDAMKAIIRLSGVDTLCTSELYYERPHMDTPPSGQPFLTAHGVLNWNENRCISSRLNLYTGEVNVDFYQCVIYFCVAEGTLIAIDKNTSKAIEKMKTGDTVLSVNTSSMTIEKDIVQKIDSVIHNNIIDIIFTDRTILSSTPDHPYYVKGKGWCSFEPLVTQQKYNMVTKQLQPGDTCFKYQDNKLIEVQVKSIDEKAGAVKTYNISHLKKNKCYFANGILVSSEEK